MGKIRFWAWLWLTLSLTLSITLNLLDMQTGVDIPFQLLAAVIAALALGVGLSSSKISEALALGFLTGVAYGLPILIQEVFEYRGGEYISWAVRFADKATWFDWLFDLTACTAIAFIAAAASFGLKAMLPSRVS